MFDEQYIDALLNAVINEAEKRGDTYIRQGVEIIKNVGDIGSELGEKLAQAPHENYSEILEHLGRIEELLKSEEGE